MKVYGAKDGTATLTVRIDSFDLDVFTDHWPASGLDNVEGVDAVFDKRTGDLVDLDVRPAGSADDAEGGGAMAALLDDAQNFAAGVTGIETLRR